MSAPEISYSVRQVTAAMGITGAMVRKYARAYEDLTHEHIRIVGRDGRQFNQKQFDAMLEAKRLVETHPGLTVDAAMRAAVGLSEVVDRLVPAQSKELDLESLKTAFSESLEASVTVPLIAKLAELQAEVAALRRDADREKQGSSPALETPQVETDLKKFGPLVRLAVWLETRLRGR